MKQFEAHQFGQSPSVSNNWKTTLFLPSILFFAFRFYH